VIEAGHVLLDRAEGTVMDVTRPVDALPSAPVVPPTALAEALPGMSAASWWRDPDGPPGPALRECLAAATAAPSLHNSQPWLFHLRRGGIDVYADRERQLPVIDPAGRELFISVGAALFNLRVAIRVHGRVPVQHLLPEPVAPNLAGRITLGPGVAPSNTVRALAWAVGHRHSNRWPFADLPVPPALLADLVNAARAEGGRLVIADAPLRDRVLELTARAERRWCDDPAYRQELTQWTRARRTVDGIPPDTYGPRSADLPVRDFGLVRSPRIRRTLPFEAEPTIALLYTPDSALAWLRAGQALERVLLTARLRGLGVSLLTQALELPRLRDQLTDHRDGRGRGDRPQAILRLGYALQSAPAPPRRPVTTVLLQPIEPG
jgi:nitroreductase